MLLALLVGTGLMAGCNTPQGPRPGPAPAPGTAPSPGAPAAEVPGVIAAPGSTAQPRPRPASPTLALLRQSERSAEGGDLDAAIAYVERAIRLDARDASLWLRLARLQLAADRPARAEQLAHKALALSGEQRSRQREAWLVVADAREAQGDAERAAEIRARWGVYRG
jgi:tetratricopeptide (TPR) repeat protein